MTFHLVFPRSLIALQQTRLWDFQLVLLHLADVLFALRLLLSSSSSSSSSLLLVYRTQWLYNIHF